MKELSLRKLCVLGVVIIVSLSLSGCMTHRGTTRISRVGGMGGGYYRSIPVKPILEPVPERPTGDNYIHGTWQWDGKSWKFVRGHWE